MTAEDRSAEYVTSPEFVEEMSRLAKVGGWNLDLDTMSLTWTDEVRRIHEVPDDYVPQLDTALDFYAPGSREAVQEALERTQSEGVPFDLELDLVTARGRTVRVRALGNAVMREGRAERLYGVFQDVTEQWRARVALQDSARENRTLLERLELAARSARFGVWDWNVGEDVSWLDDTLFDMYGLAHENPLSRATWMTMLHPDDVERVWESLHRVLTTGEPDSVEFRFIRPDGSVRHISSAQGAVLDDDGRVVRIVGANVDVTDREVAAAALRESEERYRVLFRESPDAQLIVQDGVFVDCNPAAERLLRGDRSQIIGRSPAELSPGRQPGGERSEIVARRQIHAMLLADAEVFEWVHRRFDGVHITVEVTGAPMMLHGRIALFAALRDVTERKRAEAALHDIEEKYRFITENVGDVVWTLDPATLTLTSVSPSVERLLGFTPDEVVSMPLEELLGPEAAASVRADMADRVRQLDPTSPPTERFAVLELNQRRKDGSAVWTELVTSLRVDERTGRPELLGVTRDISARKESELELRRLSSLDPLTNVLNIRGFHEAAASRLAGTSDGAVAIVFLDLDRLKDINDAQGHDAGNQALIAFAGALRAGFRGTDVIGRLGGDEFAVLVTSRQVVPDRDLLNRFNAVLEEARASTGIRLEGSVGIAWWDPADGSVDLDELIRRADAHMYRAKRAKRDGPAPYVG